MSNYCLFSVDAKDYLSAGQIFLLARHAHTNLGLTPATAFNDYGAATAADFPVVSRQWDAVLPFKDAIVDGCRDALKGGGGGGNQSASGASDICVRSLAALALLQPGTDTSALFQQFLELKEQGLKQAVGLGGVQAQAKIKAFVASVVACIKIVSAGFVDQELTSLLDEVCQTPVLEAHKMSSLGLNVMAHLPTVVRGFKPTLIIGNLVCEIAFYN